MRKTFSFSMSPPWLWAGAALLSAILAGFAVGVRDRRVLALFMSPFGFLMIVSISKRLKFWLLAFSIPLSLVQIPTLPTVGFSLSEIILIALTADELLLAYSGQDMNAKPLKAGMIIPLGLFAFAGLVTALGAGGVSWWHRYCLMPMLWFFLSSRKIRNQKEAWLLIKLSFLTIVGFVAIVVWANLTGHFESLTSRFSDAPWRLGYGLLVCLGPIQLRVWSTFLGSITALGFPACILLWIEKRKGERWWGTGALLTLAGFVYVLILSAARGAVIASILGTLLVILVSGRFRSPKLLGVIALLLVVVILWGSTFLKLLPEQNIQRLLSLLQGGPADSNLRGRIDALKFSWKLTLQNPLGVGSGYSWNRYQIDNAIIYSCLLEGMGFLGVIAFIMIVVQLVSKFGWIVLKSSVGYVRDFASIGLGTLVVGLVAGVSSDSILFEPVHAFVFWALIAVCFSAMQIPEISF
jgi:hypothetical protein